MVTEVEGTIPPFLGALRLVPVVTKGGRRIGP